jgi:DNA-binding FrmR family transcriptional regulator
MFCWRIAFQRNRNKAILKEKQVSMLMQELEFVENRLQIHIDLSSTSIITLEKHADLKFSQKRTLDNLRKRVRRFESLKHGYENIRTSLQSQRDIEDVYHAITAAQKALRDHAILQRQFMESILHQTLECDFHDPIQNESDLDSSNNLKAAENAQDASWQESLKDLAVPKDIKYNYPVVKSKSKRMETLV